MLSFDLNVFFKELRARQKLASVTGEEMNPQGGAVCPFLHVG